VTPVPDAHLAGSWCSDSVAFFLGKVVRLQSSGLCIATSFFVRSHGQGLARVVTLSCGLVSIDTAQTEVALAWSAELLAVAGRHSSNQEPLEFHSQQQ
jgi:hypothetical protein